MMSESRRNEDIFLLNDYNFQSADYYKYDYYNILSIKSYIICLTFNFCIVFSCQ